MSYGAGGGDGVLLRGGHGAGAESASVSVSSPPALSLSEMISPDSPPRPSVGGEVVGERGRSSSSGDWEVVMVEGGRSSS